MEPIISFLQDPTGIIALVAVVVAAAAGTGGAIALKRRREGQLPSAPRGVEPVASVQPPVPAEEEVQPDDEDRGQPAVEAAPVEDPLVGSAPVEAAPAETTRVEAAAGDIEVPESVPSRMVRLRDRLARSGALGRALLSVLSRGELTAEDWEEIEDSLVMADLGLEATDELMEALRTRVKVESTTDPARVRRMLVEELTTVVDPTMDRSLSTAPRDVDGTRVPATILMVGVNGTGKTTTVGKLARVLVAEGHSVMLGAADTFRAAAAQQLGTWGERVGVEVIASEREGADPASVAFEAVKAGIDQGVDVVIVDTAGRLQNKTALMDELGKVKRVMERSAPVSEVLLVLDATTGQNGMRQAQVFAEVAGVTGIVLTKLDGSAKGGIVVSVQRELGVPVKLVGLGEGVDDLAPFDPKSFVEAIVGA